MEKITEENTLYDMICDAGEAFENDLHYSMNHTTTGIINVDTALYDVGNKINELQRVMFDLYDKIESIEDNQERIKTITKYNTVYKILMEKKKEINDSFKLMRKAMREYNDTVKYYNPPKLDFF